MRLEGTLDAFSLPDIFQLLSFTKKSGALHLRRPLAEGGPELHGVVHVRDGVVTGARSDVRRQELARRLVASGVVDDESLANAAEKLADDPGLGLTRVLAEQADLEPGVAAKVAVEQITDAVFDLLRWPDGEFAFVVDESNPDDLGAQVTVEELVAEGQRRLEAWPSIAEQVPAAHAVVRLNPTPPTEPTATPQEWALLSLVDGRRTVADLVALAGRGEYAVVTALAALVGRGLLVVGEAGHDKLVRRHQLLAALEGENVVLEQPEPEPQPELPVQPPAPRGESPVIPQRNDPVTPARRPEHPEPVATTNVTTLAVNGSAAMKAEPQLGIVERDPSVNKSLLLRLIAGVRGL